MGECGMCFKVRWVVGWLEKRYVNADDLLIMKVIVQAYLYDYVQME